MTALLTGVLIVRGVVNLAHFKPKACANARDMKECEAPVSIKTLAYTLEIVIVPLIMACSWGCASGSAMENNLPVDCAPE